MSKTKIQSGYGGLQPKRLPKKCYGKRSSGKKVMNGGFNFEPTVDYTKVDQEKWDKIFDKGFKPYWEKR